MARRVANAPSCCLCCDRGAGRHWDVQGYRRHSAGLVTGGTCPLMGYAPGAGLGARCMLCPPRVDHGGVCACAVTPPKAASEPTRRAACSCRWGGCYPRMSDVALRDSASFEKVAGFRHAGVKRARPPSSNPLHVAQAGAPPLCMSGQHARPCPGFYYPTLMRCHASWGEKEARPLCVGTWSPPNVTCVEGATPETARSKYSTNCFNAAACGRTLQLNGFSGVPRHHRPSSRVGAGTYAATRLLAA